MLVDALVDELQDFLVNEKAREKFANDVKRQIRNFGSGGSNQPGNYSDHHILRPPPMMRNFSEAGRHEVLAQLDAFALTGEGHYPRIINVYGTPGVGKTAVVVYWANLREVEVRASAVSLYVDLRGFSHNRMEAPEALGLLLQCFGVSANPAASFSELSDLYSSHMSSNNPIVILDNAVDEDQVLPLLPQSGASTIIITSRKRLDGLHARLEAVDSVRVDRLKPHESLAFLREVLRSREITQDDMPQAERIVEYCAHLPIALKLAAIRLHIDPQLGLADYAEELKVKRERIDALDIGYPDANLLTVFESSYEQLSNEAAKAFRRIALRISSNIDAYSLAVLTGCGLGSAQRRLREIERAGLLEKVTIRDRYLMHDLLHDFAHRKFEEIEPFDDKRAAQERLVDRYLGCLNYAFNALNANNPMVETDILARWLDEHPDDKLVMNQYLKDFGSWRDWFAVEREHLVELVVTTCSGQPPLAQAPWLAFSLFYFLDTGYLWPDWETVNEAGLKAAIKLNDGPARARLERNFGRFYLTQVREWSNVLRDDIHPGAGTRHPPLSQYKKAVAHFKCSRKLGRDTGWDQGVATVQRELADIYLEQAKLNPSPDAFDLAITTYQEATELFRRLDADNRNPLVSLKISLSEAYRRRGDYPQAKTCLDEALHDLEDESLQMPRSKAFAYRHLAELYVVAPGHSWEEAVTALDHAYEIYRRSPFAVDPARTMARKGQLLAEHSQYAEARAAYQTAHDLLPEQSLEREVVRRWLARLPDGETEAG
ncbi:hypothetical protein J5X84_39380 [Streptosporangiaceae bacterium NEAU-GS5]|nr:hypothetical protein [Streptosporangiaceae bacterium NEAU-GS5]